MSEERVLCRLRIVSLASPGDLGDALSLSPELVMEYLQRFEADGWAVEHRGRFGGWMLTGDGRRHAERTLSQEAKEAGALGQLADSYERFVPLNRSFLRLCTRWQDGGGATAESHWPTQRSALLAELDSLHADVGSMLDDVGRFVERYAWYRERLNRSLAHLEAGRDEFLTRPTVDSYHSVWFELHEDLLATLGRQRVSEQTGGPTVKERD